MPEASIKSSAELYGSEKSRRHGDGQCDGGRVWSRAMTKALDEVASMPGAIKGKSRRGE